MFPPPRLLIISDVTSYDWLNRFYSFIWQLSLLSVMHVALELKYIIETNLIRLSYCYVSYYFPFLKMVVHKQQDGALKL